MTIHKINNETIRTGFDDMKDFWLGEGHYATLDSYDPSPIDYDDVPYNPVGYGATEQEAIDDLLQQLEN